MLVVQHSEICPPGLYGDWLHEAGAEVEVVHPYRDQTPPEDFDALMVLGGEMSSRDRVTAPWLTPLEETVRRCVADGTPLLGICLGHQVAALALGGEVEPNPRGQMVGLARVGLTEQGRRDPLLGDLPEDAVAVQWNDDVVVSVPPGAHVLAHDPRGDVQALRLGERAWSVQFHPEADEHVIAPWAASDAARHAAAGIDTAAHVAAVAAARGTLEAAWRPVVDRFVALAVAARTAREVATA